MSIGDERFRMTLSWADPETGQELLHCLATAGDEDVSVSIDCVSRDGVDSCSLDVGSLTRKQLEAARLAVEEGYYENPREARLSDLADRLGISESAVSQRLTAVERKLMVELVRACE